MASPAKRWGLVVVQDKGGGVMVMPRRSGISMAVGGGGGSGGEEQPEVGGRGGGFMGDAMDGCSGRGREELRRAWHLQHLVPPQYPFH